MSDSKRSGKLRPSEREQVKAFRKQMRDALRDTHQKYHRAESFRKALVYQKKYVNASPVLSASV